MSIWKRSLLKRQTAALRTENSMLRQAVLPENQKYLNPPVAKTPEPLRKVDKIKNFLREHAKVFAVIGICAILAAALVIEFILYFGLAR